jgi:hypothetical protein
MEEMQRTRDIPVFRFASMEDAEKFNREVDAARTPEERLEIVAQLRNQYWEMYAGREPGLQRVCRVLAFPTS